MIKKLFSLFILTAFLVNGARAQDDHKIKLQSISSIGLLNGNIGSSASLQTILGAGLMHSFLGVGVGLDYYRLRSVPLFVDLRHEFGKGKRNLFLYGDVGYNFDWVTMKNTDDLNMSFRQNDFGGGMYYDGGFGYKFGLKNSDALIFSIGYTVKKLDNKVGSGSCPFVGPCYDYIQTYQYSLSRLIIKAGWRF